MPPKFRLVDNAIFDNSLQIAHIEHGHLIITVALNYDQFKALNSFVNKIKDKLI